MESVTALRVVPPSEGIDLARAERAAASFLDALGVPGDTDATAATPRRMAQAYAELLTPRSFALTTFPNDENYDELVLASGIPVLATPGRSVNRLLNVNDPVGDGGWITFSRSHRQSSPSLKVCFPFSQVSESATSVTLVPKSEAVLTGEPSCW